MSASPSPSAVRVVRVLPATPEEVFDAWLDPEGLARWMCPGPVTSATAEVDGRVGGRFRIVMREPGTDYLHTGEYRELARPRRLVLTWVSEATRGLPTTVTVELKPHGAGETELTLVHEGLPEETAERYTDGWGQILEKLAAHVRARAAAR